MVLSVCQSLASFDATRCHADALFLRLHSRGEGDRNRQSPLRQLNYLAGT